MEPMTTESVYRDAGAGSIETSSGNLFNPMSPMFDLSDIAHALSMTCRYNGHCRQFYSVAEHSVLVSYLMEDLNLGDPLEGLLHDGSEAYLSDIPSPFKQYLPDVGAFDARIEAALREHFFIPLKKTAGCKEADWLALYIEATQLVPSGGLGPHWVDPMGYRERALSLVREYPLELYSPGVTAPFMRRYRELCARR